MITVNQKSLLSALKAAKSATERKPTIPILSGVLLTAKEGTLTLHSTDLTQTLVTSILCEGELSACIDLSAFTNAVESATPKAKGKNSGPSITIDVTADAIKVKGSAELSVRPFAIRDFPAMPKVTITNTVRYDAEKLLKALDFVALAISTDETRYHLNGLFLDKDKMVSTDGHRLHLQGELPSIGGQCIIPRKGVLTLIKLLKSSKNEVAAEFGGSFARFTVGDSNITIKLIDATFPSYAQILPDMDHCEGGLVAKRADFLSAVKVASTMSSDRTCGIELNAEFGGELSAKGTNPDIGESKAVFPGLARKAGSWRIGINARYVLDAVGALDCDEIVLANSGELDPIRIDSANRTVVIMPMRI